MNRNRGAVRWLWLAILLLSFSAASFSQIAVGISVRIGATPVAGLRTADLPRTRLLLDTRLLGLER